MSESPFISKHPVGSPDWIWEFHERQNKPWGSEGFDLITWMDAERQWECEHLESYSAERKRRDAENEARRLRYDEEQKQLQKNF